MTNEEAIEVFKNDIEICTIQQKQACDMAIEALEQDPILDTRQRERQLEIEYQHGYDKGWEEGRKALEQQPCEDCISRQRVLNDLENVIKGSEHPRQVFVFVDECVDYITSVPSVTPKAEWIPVSKELPKENEYIGDVCKYYLIQDEYGDMHVAHLSNVGWMPMESLKAIGSEIMAWRELPKPYKESEDEE